MRRRASGGERENVFPRRNKYNLNSGWRELITLELTHFVFHPNLSSLISSSLAPQPLNELKDDVDSPHQDKPHICLHRDEYKFIVETDDALFDENGGFFAASILRPVI